MKTPKILLLALSGLMHIASTAYAAEATNTVRLAASTTVEVREDWLSVTLQSRQEAANPAEVQAKLKKEMTEALRKANTSASPKALEASTGATQIFPRTNRNGTIIGWSGSAEITLQGRDAEKIASVAGALNHMAIINTQWSVSRELQEETEAKAQDQSIQAFRRKATDVAKSFGFGGYRLKDVSISSGGQGARPPLMVMAMSKSAEADMAAPLPTQAGNNTVVITISGSIELN